MDIHNYKRRLERATENVKKCNRISPKNKELMLRFIEYKRAQGTSAGRCAKFLWTLKKFSMSEFERRGHRSKSFTIMKDFELLTKQDIQGEFAKLESSTLKDSTKRDYKVIVRFFVGWVFHEKTGSPEPYDQNEHGYPAIFKGLKIKEPEETLKPSDLLTDEETQRLIDAAKNLRDKALIACLDEAGMRPGELLTLRVGNVTIEEQYGMLSMDGKTGVHPSIIIRNLAYLCQWLDSYDKRNDPKAPLWPDFEKKGQPLSYVAFRQMLIRVAVKAGVKKRVYAYLFRHTQATSDSVEITEPVMRKLYGWSKNSKTPSRYEHLSGKDVKAAKLRQAGIIVEEGKKRIRLCPRCKKPNSSDATMCHACGSVLSVKVAIEIQLDRDKLRKDIQDLKREVFLIRHGYGRLSDAEVDKLMQEEEKVLEPLRRRGLSVKIGKDGKMIPPKDQKED